MLLSTISSIQKDAGQHSQDRRTGLPSKLATVFGPASETTCTRTARLSLCQENDWHFCLYSHPTCLRVAWQQHLCNAEEPALLRTGALQASELRAAHLRLAGTRHGWAPPSVTTDASITLPSWRRTHRCRKAARQPGQIWNKPALTFIPTSKSHLCHR